MTPQELKNSILQLAIQGKLVEQRPEEGTAEELYQQIQTEKKKLIKEGKIKKEKPLPEITEDGIPFDIPESWKWARFGSIINLLSGQDMKPSEYNDAGKGIPYLTGASNIDDSGIIINRWTENAKAVAHNGDLLLTCKGTVGKTVILNEIQVHVARQIMAITTFGVDINYIKHFIETQVAHLKSQAKSIIPGIERQNVLNLLVPFPPPAEQKRIVAKIEELLPYIDRYEEAWNKLEDFNKHFPTDMQKSILQMAIQGKLVEQHPEEGTAEELYLQIQAEKKKLIKEGKIKKEKLLPEIAGEEIPFDIPESWKWVRLGNCSSYSQRKEKISKVDITSTMWSLDLEDIEKNTGRIINRRQAADRKIAGDRIKFSKGQILYSKLRPYLKKVLVAPDDGICSSEMVPFVACGNTNAQYLVYVLVSPYVDNVVNSVTYGVKMPRVGTETMVSLPIPLPPLAEQKRIVAKIEELMPLCEKLNKRGR